MEIVIGVSIMEASSMERENILGRTVPVTKASLSREFGRVRAVGSLPRTMGMCTLAVTKMTRRTDTDAMCGPMAACFRVDLLMMSSNVCFTQARQRTTDVPGR